MLRIMLTHSAEVDRQRETTEGSIGRRPVANHLLQTLPANSFAKLSDFLEDVELPRRLKLAVPRRPQEWIYFPDKGLASMIGKVGDAWQETGLFGVDGCGCVLALLSTRYPPYEVVMQIGGHGQRVALARLEALFRSDAGIQDMILRYVRVFLIQSTQTALANTQLSAEQRLGRWLLMAQDRVLGDVLHLTHEYMSIMLGVSRPTVTMALRALERSELVRQGRGHVTIMDRIGLERLVGPLYGLPEAEHAHTFSAPVPHPPVAAV